LGVHIVFSLQQGILLETVKRKLDLFKTSKLNSKFIFSSLDEKPMIFPLLAFLVPVFVRSIPEFLMGPFVTGSDVLAHYVPNTLLWMKNGVDFWNFLSVAPLFYVLLMGITAVGVPIILGLKFLAPLLLGFLGIAVFYYANKTLSWSSKKSLLVALFATLYFVALRISWDMLRSELGLIFLFAALWLLGKDGISRRKGMLLSVILLLVVFAHQLVAVIMFFVVILTAMHLGIERRILDVRRIVLCSVPAAFLFFVMVSANYGVSSDFVLLSGVPVQSSEGWNALFGFASYPDFVVITLGFLLVCYLPLLPLLVWGRKSSLNLQLKAWALLILVMLAVAIAFSIAPFAVLPYRWTLLLVFPLAFYAAEGFVRVRRSRKVMICSLLAVLSVVFLVLPSSLALPYFTLFPYYGPSCFLQNTVPLSDCRDTLDTLQWIKSEMDNDSRLLVHHAFAGFAVLTLDRNQLICYEYDDPAGVANELAENDSTHQLYLVWWVNGSGWHGQPNVPSVFDEVYRSGRIAAFQFNGNVEDVNSVSR
jgi:hypothetical protein